MIRREKRPRVYWICSLCEESCAESDENESPCGARPGSNSRLSVIEAELQSGQSPTELAEFPLRRHRGWRV